MIQPNPTASPKKDTDLLREELLAKLTDEWAEKWAAQHGPAFTGIADVPSREAFLDALAIDIYVSLEQANGLRNNRFTKLSNDTLLRFFNEQHKSAFAPNTRNVLAMYVGYDNFADFQTQHQREVPVPPPVINVYALLAPSSRQWLEQPGIVYALPTRRPSNWLWIVILLLGLLTWAGYYYLRQYRSTRTLTAADITPLQFTVAAQNHAYNPAKVTFAYDFSQLNIDTLTIDFGANRGAGEQTSVKLTQPVGTYTFDFYKPGLHFIEAKHASQVLKRIAVYVRSHGWACWYETIGWVNTNVAYHRFYKNGGLFLHPNEIQNASHRSNYQVQIRRTQPFAIQIDSLTVEYDLKYSPDEYAISCYNHLLQVGFNDGTQFRVDFSRPGCVDSSVRNQPPTLNQNCYAFAFPRLFYDWSHVKIQWKANRLRVWVNNELFTNSPNNVPNGRLISVGLFSKGSAMYDNVRISNSYTGRTVFSDDFDVVPKSTEGY